MLSKEELLEKDVSELETIAQKSGAVYNQGDDKDKLVYAILDRQAEELSTARPSESKRKRTRITRKDTDRVYSVHGDEGCASPVGLFFLTSKFSPSSPCTTFTL